MTLTGYLPDQVGVGGRSGELARLAEQAALTGPTEVALILRAMPSVPRVVIELGCGSGEFVRCLRGALPGAIEGADPDRSLLSAAPAGCGLLTDRWVAERAGTADLVVVRFVAQHLGEEARSRLWRQACEVLRPGGTLAVIDVDDADFGAVQPHWPAVVPVYRKLATWQHNNGGSRCVLLTAARELRLAGWCAPRRWRDSVVRTGAQIRDLAVHLGPERHAGHVSRGALDLTDLAVLTVAWNNLVADPDARAEVAVHLLTAIKPFEAGAC